MACERNVSLSQQRRVRRHLRIGPTRQGFRHLFLDSLPQKTVELAAETFENLLTRSTVRSAMRALLALEDGRFFEGESFGATGTCVGEVCFNTAMTGYQEVLTDPSYRGQI